MRIFNYFKNPRMILHAFLVRTAILWGDKTYLMLYHYAITGKKLNLDNPKTYSEKCQWMKLYYQRPELTTMVDKYDVKKYVADRIGSEYVVECYGVWDKFDDIDFDKLPNQFVLKGTGSSGGLYVCKDKKKFDKSKAKEILEKDINRNYYALYREWAYKNVKPRIIAERYLDSLLKEDTIEYKITCMGGVVQTVTICTGIAHAAYELRHNDNYSRDWKRQNWYARYTPTGKEFKKTPEIEKLIELSEKLTQGIPQVRADWYIHNGQIYFGELTFYTWAGWPMFTPESYDYEHGKNFILPKEKFIEKRIE